MADLRVTLAGLELRNPILSASGTFGHGLEMQHIVPPAALGGLVSKTVTREPRKGNPMPRIAETEAGFLNSIGLENRGLQAYLDHTLPEVAGADTAIITNVGGHDIEEFAEVARRLAGYAELAALEINLSCPNVDGGKLPFSTDPARCEEAVAAVRAAVDEVAPDKPIFVKLSPNVSFIDELAVAAEAGGASALTAVNTALGMGIDWRSGKPALNTVVGGYSGVALKPIALRCAYQCAQAVRIPIIGCGGIACADDVLQFLAVGCSAVQVGTSSFSDPALLGRLADEVDALLDEAGFAAVSELIERMPRRALEVETA